MGLVMIVAGCAGSSAAPVGTAQVLAQPGPVLGDAWKTVTASSGPLGSIARECADPRVILSGRRATMTESATSDVWSGRRYRATVEGAAARSAVARFTDADAATFALGSLTASALRGCVASVLTTYVRTRAVGDVDPRDSVTPEQVPARRIAGSGTTAALLRAHFDENVLGGSDNLNEVGLAARRRGSTIVMSVVTTTGQSIGPASATRPADRLATTMDRRLGPAS